MVELNLYKSGEVDETIQFPSTWNDLTVPELHAAAKVLLSEFKNEQQPRSIILLEIIRLRCIAKKIPLSIVKKLDPEDLAIFGLPLVDFIYEAATLSRQPYPTLKIRGLSQKFVGPADHFDTMISAEYEAANIHYLQFKTTNDVECLAKLAAVLYRPAGTEFLTYSAKSDSCKTYDYEKMAKHFLKLDPWVLLTIYIWYTGCNSLLPLHFPTLYEGGSSTDDEIDIMIFTKCIHAAAGPKNGTRENVRRTLLKALYFDMELEAIKAKEQKAHYDSLK